MTKKTTRAARPKGMPTTNAHAKKGAGREDRKRTATTPEHRLTSIEYEKFPITWHHYQLIHYGYRRLYPPAPPFVSRAEGTGKGWPTILASRFLTERQPALFAHYPPVFYWHELRPGVAQPLRARLKVFIRTVNPLQRSSRIISPVVSAP